MWTQLHDSWLDDDGAIYRRIKKVDDCIKEDSATKRLRLMPNAFVYDDGSGCSVNIEEVMHDLHVSADDVVPDWTTHGQAIVPMDEVMVGECVGVVHDPQPNEPTHGLIRVQGELDGPKVQKRQWRDVRDRLLNSALYRSSRDEEFHGLA